MRPHALPRRRRGLAAAEFTRCLRGGRVLSAHRFRLHWLPADGPARLGMAVSRKVDPRAVVRNRIKRTIRESFRCRDALPGGLLVVTARPVAAAATAGELRADLARLWLQLAALNASVGAVTMPATSASPAAAADDFVAPVPPPPTVR